MTLTYIGPDGLRVSTQAMLSRLATDEKLAEFANGLIAKGLAQTNFSGPLAAALHHPGPTTYPLLTTLLVLDGEVETVVADTRRVFPLPAFISYRANLPPAKFPLETLRLPPLNPDGHYILTSPGQDSYVAIRLDLHPRLKVMGHVRIALGRPTQAPVRLPALEHRLERQTLTDRLIHEAIAGADETGPAPVTAGEWEEIRAVLRGLAFPTPG